MKQVFIAIFTTLMAIFFATHVKAQYCSKESLTAKYWQYRANLNKHFVMSDRKPEGCIGNGITRSEHEFSQFTCGADLLHGYGIPATSIWQTPNGSFGMGDRVAEGEFKNLDCAKDGLNPNNVTGVSWEFEKHNYLEYGSETPHQIGWYLVMLATEYELLRKNGQLQEQQRTLEEIFLALQAYRRLDITANCLVKSRYDEITDGFEVENCDIWVANHHYTEDACLCAEKYHNQQCKGAFGDAKWHFDIPCKTMCPWTPNLTGYSGFYVREDAVQEQEGMHDASEDKWNIDLVGSAFAMSQSPPCDSNFSPACYNEKKVNFLSQDQTFSIMTGLAMVKRYVPPTATVTTCDGVVYHPFDIVQEISNGLVKLPQNATRHVFWPGSENDDCCYKPVKFGECAGGNLQWTYAGLEYMHNYINEGDDDHWVESLDRLKWGRKNGRRAFFAQAMSVGFDIGTYGTDNAKQKIIDACVEDKMEILLLMNDLLHPGEPNIMDDETNAELKALFEEMLCSAPCDGPCFKPDYYDDLNPAEVPEFNCANTPHWIGQRWEGYGYPPPNQQAWQDRKARQYNGLDFMALYNTYMLCFPEEQTPFYNPDRPEPTTYGHLLGENKIEGPTTLCPGTSADYLLKKSNPVPTVFKEIIWESSSNISLSSTSTNPTTATANTGRIPSYIGVTFEEQIRKQQFYNGVAQETEGKYIYVGEPLPYWVPPQPITIADNCIFDYRKPIISELPEYQVVTEVDFCQWIYKAIAHGPQYTPETTLSWVATDNNTGLTLTGNGTEFDFSSIIPQTPNLFGIVSLRFTVENNCDTEVFTLESPYFVCSDSPQGGNTQGRQILVSPNPTNGQISIRIVQNQTQDFYSTDPNGIRIQIYPGNGNLTTLLDAQMYNSGQIFNVANLPNGSYHVRANASDLSPIQTTFFIIH